MARKMYISNYTSVPIYNIADAVSITVNNISNFFTVTNDSYYFAGQGNIFTSNNTGVKSSTAKTTLTALVDMNISFNYSYSTEKSYDKFTLIVGGKTIANAVSGETTTSSYTGTILTGQTIVFQYSKDASQNANDDKCTFSNMSVAERIKAGEEMQHVARTVKKQYVSVNNVARKVQTGLVGVNNVARRFFGSIVPKIYFLSDINNSATAPEGVVINDSFTGLDNGVWRFYLDATMPENITEENRARAYTEIIGDLSGKTISVTCKFETPNASGVTGDFSIHDYDWNVLYHRNTTSQTEKTFSTTIPEGAYRIFLGINQFTVGNYVSTFIVSSCIIDGVEHVK